MNTRFIVKQGVKQGVQQRGVALITALLIVSLVTVVAVAMASRQQLDIRRTSNMFEADQTYLYALAAETWATQILVEDAQNSSLDALSEDWATELPPVPVEGGAVGGQIDDLQGRFNLNNLVDDKGEAIEAQLKAFQTILEEAGRDKEEVNFSPFLANRVLDWIDEDIDATADGAEDLEYLNLPLSSPPYRAANRFMVSPSELGAVLGFSLPALKHLLPLISSLPEATPVNVNTASAAVLMSLHEDISMDIAEELIALRKESDFDSADNFVEILKDDYEIELDPKRLSVSSDYFLVSIDATIGRTELRLYSLLQRKNNKVVTLRRSIGAI